MEKDVKFSVITVCYNAKDELPRTLASLWAQSYPHYESIVVDGGSRDGTAELICQEPRIAKYVSEPDNGVYEAMNKGIKMASGAYVIFMNAGDEFFNPEVLARAAQVLKKHPACRLLYGDACLVREDGSQHFREYFKPVTEENICHQSIFYARELFEAYGLYDTAFRIVADYDFNLRAIAGRGVEPCHFSYPVCRFYEGGLSSGAKYAVIQQADSRRLADKWGERKELPCPKIRQLECAVRAEEMLSAWQASNALFKRRLVYRLGDSAGLFSEINNMLFAMVWAFDNGVKFELCSKYSNLGAGGWDDFFVPFAEEMCDAFLLKNNRRYVPSVSEYSPEETLCYKESAGIDFLTQDIFRRFFENKQFIERTFDFRDLGVAGNSFAAAAALAKAVYRLNLRTREEIRELIFPLQLPESYLAVQMRAGDIAKECAWRRQKLLGAAPYARKIKEVAGDVRNVFAFADDWRLVCDLRALLPEYRVYTLCGEKESGFDYEAFAQLGETERRAGIAKILANIEICRGSRHFIGTRVSNPSWFLRLIMPEERVSFVDCERLMWQSEFDEAAAGGRVDVVRIFGMPLLKIVHGPDKIKVRLFSVLPLYKIRTQGNKRKHYLFSCIPYLKISNAA